MVQLRAGLPSPCLTLTEGDGLFNGRPVKENTKENDSQKIAVFLAEVQTTDLQNTAASEIQNKYLELDMNLNKSKPKQSFSEFNKYIFFTKTYKLNPVAFRAL